MTDPTTIDVTGAYLKPEARGRGTADALLGKLLDWARERGYARCAVDFESANPTASRYWPRHFTPVCHSLIRRLDERIAPGGSDQTPFASSAGGE